MGSAAFGSSGDFVLYLNDGRQARADCNVRPHMPTGGPKRHPKCKITRLPSLQESVGRLACQGQDEPAGRGPARTALQTCHADACGLYEGCDYGRGPGGVYGGRVRASTRRLSATRPARRGRMCKNMPCRPAPSSARTHVPRLMPAGLNQGLICAAQACAYILKTSMNGTPDITRAPSFEPMPSSTAIDTASSPTMFIIEDSRSSL